MTTRRLKVGTARDDSWSARPNGLLRSFMWLAELVLFWPVKAAFAVTGHMQANPSVKDTEAALWRCACIGLFYAFYLINICAVLEKA